MDVETREPTPAGQPLWDGIYNFPWQIGNLQVLVFLWIAFSLLALLFAGYHTLFSFISEQAGKGDLPETGMFMIAVRAGGYIFAGLTALAFLSALYPAACFLAVVEDSAGGNEDVKWESIAWTECIGKLFFLSWVFGCSAAAGAIPIMAVAVVVPLASEVWWLMVLGLALLFFPVVLLSTLSAGSAWFLIEPQLLTAYVRRPHVGAIIYANTAFFALPSALFGWWTIMDYHLWLTPVTGLMWSCYFLAYARVLGRAAWVLSESDEDRRRKSRR